MKEEQYNFGGMLEFSWAIKHAPNLDQMPLHVYKNPKNSVHLPFLHFKYVIHFKTFFIFEVYTHTEIEQGKPNEAEK